MTLSTSLGFEQWLAVAGVLLLLLSLSSAFVQRSPISSSTLYLGLGIALGPRFLGWLELRVAGGGHWFERLTEVAVVVALFISGLKLRLPPRHAASRRVPLGGARHAGLHRQHRAPRKVAARADVA